MEHAGRPEDLKKLFMLFGKKLKDKKSKIR
jgi:hypothetical protein